MDKLGVTITGRPYSHFLYHLVLMYSNFEAASLCFSESFEALSGGLRGAPWRLGGVPGEHRADNLSAATHELLQSRGRGFTEQWLTRSKPSTPRPDSLAASGTTGGLSTRIRPLTSRTKPCAG